MSFDLNQYLNRSIACECGQTHQTLLKDIVLLDGAIYKTAQYVKKYNHTRVFLIADCNTMDIAGHTVEAELKKAGISCTSYIYREKELVADETALGKILISIPQGCDLIISVGSGTLNDLGKFLSHRLGIDFYIVATAPSMDGYASNVSPLISNQVKSTYESRIPSVIIGDLDILSQAPEIMIAAGVGDILGKYICLIDWQIAHLIQEEYFCPFIADMVRTSVEAIVENAPKLVNREKEAIAAVMEGLILSGIAMSYAGNSRPASGSEHHLSHFWEMQFLFQDKPAVLHGIKVGIGTVTAARLYARFRQESLDFSMAEKKAAAYEEASWEAAIKEAYGEAGESVAALEKSIGKNTASHVLERLPRIQKHLPDIYALLDCSLPDADCLTELLKSAGAPVNPKQVGVDAHMFRNSILYAKDLRNRYGLLQLLFDLGLNETYADEAVRFFY